MLAIAAGIVLAVAIIAAVPLLLCWLIWLVTGRGRARLSQAQLDHERQVRRTRNIADLKIVGFAVIGFTLFVAVVFAAAAWH